MKPASPLAFVALVLTLVPAAAAGPIDVEGDLGGDPSQCGGATGVAAWHEPSPKVLVCAGASDTVEADLTDEDCGPAIGTFATIDPKPRIVACTGPFAP